MSKQTNNEENRQIHEALVKHLGDPSSCKGCSNTCGCFRLKQALSNLGEKVFLEKAIAGEQPIAIQELYNKKFSAMAEKCNP